MRTHLQNKRKTKIITNYGDWIMEITSANYVQRQFAKKKEKPLRFILHCGRTMAEQRLKSQYRIIVLEFFFLNQT